MVLGIDVSVSGFISGLKADGFEIHYPADKSRPKLPVAYYRGEDLKTVIASITRFAAADAHADEVVEIAIRQALDIQIDGRAFDLQCRAADDLDFFSRVSSALSQSLSGSNQLDLQFDAKGARSLLKRGKGNGGIGVVEQAVHSGAARFHAGGHLGFGEFVLIQQSLELQSQRAFPGAGFHFFKRAVLSEQVAQVAAAMSVLSHDAVSIAVFSDEPSSNHGRSAPPTLRSFRHHSPHAMLAYEHLSHMHMQQSLVLADQGVDERSCRPASRSTSLRRRHAYLLLKPSSAGVWRVMPKMNCWPS
jgi:hypothetical protein